ncbi:gluzincin family metallopeptidase [Seonamhaeicola marinus]|uniref:M1 family metallopeptidase n=1 Tax=Seonamhaeicola marinus TaxID=1912246 RepID=A0A5D0I738_9FLAO|nr:M1 family metallopeptidase [Seonamhaeicola marinus]TYA78759.1 M1 family metallopeptidase [Seonamhaeicola marinus]
MKFRLINCFFFYFVCFSVFSQNKIDLKAVFDVENRKISISQTIRYYNTSQETLDTIYLNNWGNSYSTKITPLAKRIADEYKNDFHLAKNKDRGYSVVTSIKQNGIDLEYCELENSPDVVKVTLNNPLMPKDYYEIKLDYVVRIPNSKFTKYGLTNEGDINLRYWYITPAIYDGNWQYYSNEDLDDLFIPKADITLDLYCPKDFKVTSELDLDSHTQNTNNQNLKLSGKNRLNTKLFLNKQKIFNTIQNDDFALVSGIEDKKLQVIDKVLITEKILGFLEENLGKYPHKKLIVSHIDYNKNPIYGLNFLPKFLKPYPNRFQYEIKLLKIALNNYLENTLLLNPRKEQWLMDGIQIYYLIKYVDEYYPKMKFLGSFADIWGIRAFHAADMKFNDKYTLVFMLMARTNRDQKLTMPKDSLLKFNSNIANQYKAGLGLRYLDDFVNKDIVENSLSEFVKENKLKDISTKDFEDLIKSKTSKDISWFFDDYLNTRKKIDFKIKNVIKTEDSVTLTIKNKRENSMPISLYALKDDSIISKTWVQNISKSKTITIPRNDANKLVLNYNKAIPEINVRDNWKSLKGNRLYNKPLQFRVFQDIEDPHYSQVFFMPVIEYNNIYDGLSLGARMYNKTVLRKLLNYKIEPRYAFGSRTLTGSTTISNIHYLENKNLYRINYGIGASYSSYAEDLFVRRITPSLTFYFRDDNDFRSNKRKILSFRYIDIHRDKDVNNILTSSEPNYSVFSARYIHSNDNLINFGKWTADFQLAKEFSKVSFKYEYRKLFESNRQLNLRFFTGAFISNKTDLDSNYFSFALDRPTDYLFEYAYLGRSESSGIFSQQFITAEGGFKSKLEFPYANQWMSTLNASTTLWKYVLLYGDIGLVKNKFDSTHFVYDSGIRLNLVTDYFEIYFPLYSNLGWEIGQPNYDQKIRFKFTVDPQVLLGLFRRRWF